jgi:hypothetical protein
MNEKRREYRCLDSTLGDDDESDWLIVSEWTSSLNAHSIVCWLFADYHAQRGNAIYRIRAEDCHEGIGSRLSAGIVQPEAILVEVDRGDELAIGWHRFAASTTAAMPTMETAEIHERTEQSTNAYNSTGPEQVTVQITSAASDNDDWSFLEGQEIISIYDEPDIVPLENADGGLSRGRYDVANDNRNVRQQYSVIGSAAATCESAIESKPLLMLTFSVVGLLMTNRP